MIIRHACHEQGYVSAPNTGTAAVVFPAKLGVCSRSSSAA